MIMVILRSFGKRISTEFFPKGSQKSNKTTKILQFSFVLEGKYLSWHHMSKFPDFSGFWEFPKDPKVVPIYVLNSQELGKFPESSNTGKGSYDFERKSRNLILLRRSNRKDTNDATKPFIS